MKFNLNLDYKRKDEAKEKMSDAEITADYLEFAVRNVYEKGLEGQKRRIFGRLQRKMDAAIESKEYVIDIEQAEFDLIKKAFNEATFDGALSKYVNVLDDYLESLKFEEAPKEEKNKEGK